MIPLLPAPRELVRRPGELQLRGSARLDLRGDRFVLTGAREALASLLARAGVDLLEAGDGARGQGPRVALQHAPGELPDEGYELEVDAGGVRVRAGGRRGALHAVRTLAQLRGEGGIPCVRVRDWPDLARRGFMLDISRDRVPEMAALRDLVDTLASLKMNVLELYTEHTFAYVGHEAVWRDASPLTASQIRELDAHCCERGVELVPNQNSFGHMERWLRHAEYRHLGERSEGGSCLVPDAAAAAFMASLFDQLLPCFESRRVNVGCDETFDLGKGRSRDRCAELGTGRVYLEYLGRLVDDLHARGRHVEFWGDVVLQHPELLDELPRKDATALAWHYEAPVDPASVPAELLAVVEPFGWTREGMAGFAPRAPAFARAGIPFQVCPGTSSWNTFVGRFANARENIRDAVREGLRAGAGGMLLTDWGDNGHMQPPVVSLAPLALGAALSWGSQANADLDLPALLERFVLPGRGVARAALDLADCYRETGLESTNAAPFFVAMRMPLAAAPNAFTLRGEPDRAELEATAERIDGALARLTADDPASRDLRQAGRLARHGTWRLLRGRLGAGPEVAELAADLRELIAHQRESWLRTARPGGLRDSLARLEALLGEYGGEAPG
jgi:hexosaminidase